MSEAAQDVVVIGGGVVGLATALKLRMAGRDVLLIDRDEPARSTSYGNAGVLAVSDNYPLASFKRLLGAPGMLMNPRGPLRIRPNYLGRITPWLFRFALSAMPGARRAGFDAVKALNDRSVAAHRRLLDAVGRPELLVQKGMLVVARSAGGVKALEAESEPLRHAGSRVRLLDAAEVAALEPALAGRVAGGALQEDVAHVLDPYALARAYADAFLSAGGRIEQRQAIRIAPTDSGSEIDTDQAPWSRG
jgi:glycine/D-amino acid oxidase-like deaminating enzyme